MDMFDTIGTLIGVATKANMLDEKGKLQNMNKALLTDAIGTTLGACFGTSAVCTYVESASGVAEGGRTGLTALSTTGMFIIALFLSPLFLMIPSAATAPSLVLVGLFMLSPIKDIELGDFTEAIPAFFTIIIMPLAYSIADGIVFGIISYVLIKLFAGQGKKVSVTTYILAALFVLKFLEEGVNIWRNFLNLRKMALR
jgi:AGZA family xanthine/uracil permease-like MFS transporter